jgi:uncharacterized membrane protein (DUF485 family)
MADASTGRDAPGTTDTIDFRRIEASAEFRELVSRRKRFLTIASIIVFGEFGLYLLLAAYAPGFMGTQIVDGLPIAWLAAMAQIFLTWALTWVYLRASEREFEPLEERARRQAEARFSRDEQPAAAETTTEPERTVR